MMLLFILAVCSTFSFITYIMAVNRSRNALVFAVLGFFFGIFPMAALQIIGSSKAAAAEMLKLKGLVDEGKLTQEEFDILRGRLFSTATS